VHVLGCRLRVEVEITSTGEWLWAEYERMTVASEADKYRLQVIGYRENAGDAFNDNTYWRSNGMQFSTYDEDNDDSSSMNCANSSSSGWWFRDCSIPCLNGVSERYGVNPQYPMLWYSTEPDGEYSERKVSTSRMMLQCQYAAEPNYPPSE